MLTRRGMLGGLIASLAMPAIVRAESLMVLRTSIADLRNAAPRTLKWQCEEIARKLYEAGARPISSQLAILGKSQLHVDFISVSERNHFLPVEQDFTFLEREISDRTIDDAVFGLLGELRPGQKFGSMPLELPRSEQVIRSALGEYEGIQVRGVVDWHIGTDSAVQRFDVTRT